MAFWMLAGMAMNAYQADQAAQVEKNNILSRNIVNEANSYAINLVRKANNKLAAARSSLAYYNQDENNKRVLENAGSAAEAAQVNYRRARDEAVTGSVEDQIAAAERAGAQASAAAFSGLTGGVVDVVRGATALRQSRIEQRTNDMLRMGDWDASKQAANIMQAGWDSLDTSDLTPLLDYSEDIPQITKMPKSSILSDVATFMASNPKGMADSSSKMGGFFKKKVSPMDRYLIGNQGSGD